MLESTFEKKCINELRKLPFSYWPDKTEASSVRGQPDRIGCVCGFYIAIEFKRTKGDANKKTGRIVLQRKILEEIALTGGYGFIAHPDNWDSIYNRIQVIAALNRESNEQTRNKILRRRAGITKPPLI
jgi:hypothetical protein